MTLRDFYFCHSFILFGLQRYHVKRCLIVACSVHDVFVGIFFDDVYLSIVKNCDASVVAEHAD